MEETKWIVDKAHSGIEFSIRHMMISTVRGKFKDFDTEITGNPDDFDTVKGRFRISVASIDTGNPDRDNHLRSDEILAMKEFPDIVYTVKKVTGAGEEIEIIGDLTIRGVTREVVFKGEYGGMIKDPYGNQRFGLTASSTINRGDFGVKWNMVLEGGGFLLGEKANLYLQLEAFHPPN
ncbi:MAG: YceI family protein [Candidatus Thermoplasmatota archaeon]|nr:YceI family protein [Candidatus Thermoplasmatota archaeon]